MTQIFCRTCDTPTDHPRHPAMPFTFYCTVCGATYVDQVRQAWIGSLPLGQQLIEQAGHERDVEDILGRAVHLPSPDLIEALRVITRALGERPVGTTQPRQTPRNRKPTK